MRNINEYDYQAYIKNKSWRCEKSPTGAHYWKESSSSMFKCEHCKETKEIPIPESYPRFYIRRKYKNDNKNN